MLELAKQQRLLIVVDDADRIDEPSAALLSSIASRAERSPVVVAVALEQDAGRAASASLRLFDDIATIQYRDAVGWSAA